MKNKNTLKGIYNLAFLALIIILSATVQDEFSPCDEKVLLYHLLYIL
ncbi:31832_t:CDS:2 [Gigaspora margarita]|uniref:31832_t:CDS:1 n=1 Tax=Gigaspora margarita TaxID=4874 RepID=A0ABN7UL57_GIGMA|nr:31832_t:CDS:2 [Gigaspora margarita]